MVRLGGDVRKATVIDSKARKNGSTGTYLAGRERRRRRKKRTGISLLPANKAYETFPSFFSFSSSSVCPLLSQYQKLLVLRSCAFLSQLSSPLARRHGERKTKTKCRVYYVRMGEQFLHDKVVVNLPGQLSPLFHRLQLLVAFNLRAKKKRKKKKKNIKYIKRQLVGDSNKSQGQPDRLKKKGSKRGTDREKDGGSGSGGKKRGI